MALDADPDGAGRRQELRVRVDERGVLRPDVAAVEVEVDDIRDARRTATRGAGRSRQFASLADLALARRSLGAGAFGGLRLRAVGYRRRLLATAGEYEGAHHDQEDSQRSHHTDSLAHRTSKLSPRTSNTGTAGPSRSHRSFNRGRATTQPPAIRRRSPRSAAARGRRSRRWR